MVSEETSPTTGAVAVADDRRARFDAIWAAHAGAVHAYAARRIGADRAGDVVADTFLVVWRRLEDPTARPTDPAWLFGVARNVLRQDRRSTVRLERLLANAPTGTSAPSAERDAVARRQVAEALAGLDDLDAEIVLLARWEGLTSAEIGEVVGLRPAAVRMRLSRARRHLATVARAEEAR